MQKKLHVFTYIMLMLPLLFGAPVASGTVGASTQSIDSIEVAEYFEAPVDKKKDKEKKKDKVEEVTLSISFLASFGINLLAVLCLILLVYHPGNRNSEQVFTFILFNVIIFIITYVLNEVKISMGAAFGLFAVFSMLRYRTLSISMKDMTYLFIFIALGLVNAVHLRYDVMIVMNLLVIVITFALDSNLLYRPEISKTIQYDNIEMIRPENHQKLIQDLRERTGLQITRIEIQRVNFLRDSARITIYYKQTAGGIYANKNGNGKRHEHPQ